MSDRLEEIKKKCERVTVIRGWIRGSQNNLILTEDFPWLIAEVKRLRSLEAENAELNKNPSILRSDGNGFIDRRISK